MAIINRSRLMQALRVNNETSEIQFAKIDPNYIEGRPRLIFDGEEVVSLKSYPYFEHYTPFAGDRVMLLMKVIIGKIV